MEYDTNSMKININFCVTLDLKSPCNTAGNKSCLSIRYCSATERAGEDGGENSSTEEVSCGSSASSVKV